jgi:hypothetical protein
MLVHAGLAGTAPARRGVEARAALERLVRRSGHKRSDDAVALVAEARAALDRQA